MADLTASELTALSALRVTDRQAVSGGSFVESVEAWRAGPTDRVLGLCFSLGGQPIGMTLFKRPPLSPAWVADGAASSHGLKIASPWQGQGWGHVAFRLGLERLRIEWPDCQWLMLAVDADNAAALAVYRGMGMEEIDHIATGPNGPEFRLRLALGD